VAERSTKESRKQLGPSGTAPSASHAAAGAFPADMKNSGGQTIVTKKIDPLEARKDTQSNSAAAATTTTTGITAESKESSCHQHSPRPPPSTDVGGSGVGRGDGDAFHAKQKAAAATGGGGLPVSSQPPDKSGQNATRKIDRKDNKGSRSNSAAAATTTTTGITAESKESSCHQHTPRPPPSKDVGGSGVGRGDGDASHAKQKAAAAKGGGGLPVSSSCHQSLNGAASPVVAGRGRGASELLGQPIRRSAIATPLAASVRAGAGANPDQGGRSKAPRGEAGSHGLPERDRIPVGKGCSSGGGPAAPGSTAGIGCDAMAQQILRRKTQFNRYNRRLEQEKVGMCNTAGIWELRTMSFIMNPLICFAILGPQYGNDFFELFPERLIGGGKTFVFQQSICAIRKILNAYPQLQLKDIQRDSRCSTLYFSTRLQEIVISQMQNNYSDLWTPLECWIMERFQQERAAQKDKDGDCAATSSEAPAAGSALSAADAKQRIGVEESRGGSGCEAIVSGSENAGEAAPRCENHTPFSSGHVEER
jgi:hypothetical protein